MTDGISENQILPKIKEQHLLNRFNTDLARAVLTKLGFEIENKNIK